MIVWLQRGATMRVMMPSAVNNVNKIEKKSTETASKTVKVDNAKGVQSNGVASKVDLEPPKQVIDPTQAKTANLQRYDSNITSSQELENTKKQHVSEYQKNRLLNTYKIMSRVRDLHEHESLVNDLFK